MPHMFQLQAYHRGIHYPHHLLLTLGWYGQNWWQEEDQNFTCTAQERESVLNRSLAFLQCDFIEDLNLTTDTGIVNLPPPYISAIYNVTRYVNLLKVTLYHSRLVGNTLLKRSSILVYHHFILSRWNTLNTAMMQPGPWHMLLIRPLMVKCVCVWVGAWV